MTSRRYDTHDAAAAKTYGDDIIPARTRRTHHNRAIVLRLAALLLSLLITGRAQFLR